MSERVYGWLLHLYPRRFQDAYGEAMCQAFRDRLRTENRFTLWVDVLCDLAVSLPREYQRPPEDQVVTKYSLSDSAVEEIASRGLFRWNLLFWIYPAVVMASSLFRRSPPLWCLISAAIIMTVTQTILRSDFQRFTSDRWRGFEAKIDGDEILLKSLGSTKQLPLSKIIYVAENPNFGLIIRTWTGPVWVPNLTSGYDEIRKSLAAWEPFEKTYVGPSVKTCSPFQVHTNLQFVIFAFANRTPEVGIVAMIVVSLVIILTFRNRQVW